jgi:hypothetical protein
MVASTALAAGGLLVAAPPVHAAPVFTDAETVLEPSSSSDAYNYSGSSNSCSDTTTGGGGADVPVVENGPTASASTSVSATYANSGVPGDTATGVASASASGKVTSVGGNPSTMDLTVNSSAQLNNALGTSADCSRLVYAGVALDFRFTVAQAGFMTFTTKTTGTGQYGEMYLYAYDPANNSESSPYVDTYGFGNKFDSTTKVYLPAGTYAGYFEGQTFKRSKASYALSGSTSVHATFAVAGSQTAAQTGKGHRYATLASARSCATDSLGASITHKKKRANQVKWVKFYVNDTKVKKVKTPNKGEAVNLPVADDQAAEVLAKVKLFPKKAGKPAKLVETSASYEACS